MLTAAMIDSRYFIAARSRADTELTLLAGPRIAFRQARLGDSGHPPQPISPTRPKKLGVPL
jgi:hypothetical protein